MRIKFYLWNLLAFFILSLSAAGCSDDDDVTPAPEPPVPAEKLTLTLSVENVTAHGADLKVTPSDNNQTYFADVAPAAMFEGQTDAALIEMISSKISAADLKKGESFFPASSMKLEAKSDYVFFALGYTDGKVTSKLFREMFSTLKEGDEKPDPEPGVNPQVEFTVQAGALDGTGKNSTVTLIAKCTSQDATYAAVLIDAQGVIDEAVAAGNSLEAIVDANGANMQRFEKGWLDQMNLKDPESPDGVVLSLNGADPDTRFDMLLDVKNDKGGRTVKRAECTTESRVTKVQLIDEAFFVSNIWDFKSERQWKYKGNKPMVIDFFATWCGPCKMMAPILDKCSIDYDGRASFYQMDVEQNRAVFEAVCAMAEHDGSIPFFLFVTSEGKLTKLVGATNEDYFRSLVDSILEGAPAPVNPPVVSLYAAFDPAQNGILYQMKCSSQDASYAAYCIATQEDLDRIITESQVSIEQIMDIPDNSHQLPAEAVASMNGEGLQMVFNQGTKGVAYSFLLDVRNEGRGRVVKRVDTRYEEVKYEEGVTVSNVRPDGLTIHMEIPAAVKERGNAIRWNRSCLPMYNMLKMNGVTDAELLLQNAGLVLTESGDLFIDEEHSMATDPDTGEQYPIGDPLVPGEPVIFLSGEFGWGEDQFGGWGEGYYKWMFDYDRWMADMGGGGVMSARPGVVRAINEAEAKYWNGYYEARNFMTKQPGHFDGQVKFSTVDMTPIQGTLRFEPDKTVKRYCVMLTDDATLNDIMLPMLDNKTEYLQWFTTSFFAFQQLGVMAYEGPTDLNLSDWAGELGPGMKFHILITAMGDDAGMLQNFSRHEVVMPERTLPAPVVEVKEVPSPETGKIEPYEVWFNIKKVEGEVLRMKYAANYKRDFDYMLTHGYDYYSLVDQKGNELSNADLTKVNSAEGLNVKFDVRPFSTMTLSAVGYNSEGLGSKAGWAEATAAELPAAETVNSPYFESLKGDWTASAIISRYDYQTSAWVNDAEPTKFKVSIKNSVCDFPEKLPEEIYGLYKGMTREQVDAMYQEFKERAKLYDERLKRGNCLQCCGLGFDPKGRLDYKSPYDLFTSTTYSASSTEGLFEDFGAKWYLKINADGKVSVPINVNYMNPLAAWSMKYGRKDTYYLVGIGEKDFVGMTKLPQDKWDEFPVEVSADSKTITIKPIVRPDSKGVQTTYYPSVMNYMQSYRPIDAGKIVSEITLTKGWTEPASTTMNRNIKYAAPEMESANGVQFKEKNYSLLKRTFFKKEPAKVFKKVRCTQLNGEQISAKVDELVRETSARLKSIHEKNVVRREALERMNAADGGLVELTPLMLNKDYLPEMRGEGGDHALVLKAEKLNGNIHTLPGKFLE